MHKDKIIQQLVDGYGDWVTEESENIIGGTGRFTKNLFPYTAIFSPVRINKLTVKNRIVMGPMGNLQMSEEDGRPNDKMLQYFFARAKGGAGLLTTGLIPISHGIDPTVTEPRNTSTFPRIDGSRTLLSGWRDLAQGVHAYGSKIFVQLTPGLGRVGPPTCVLNDHKLPRSASVNPNFYLPALPCLPFSDKSLKKIVKNAGQASLDAMVAGLDGVYLHGHEGYLLDQMTSQAFNRRSLGRYADWQAFGLDMVSEIRKRVGPEFPIMYRIDLSLALNETYNNRMNTVRSLKKFRNGRSIEDTLNYMDNLVKVGVDIFDVDLGCYDNWWLPHPPAGMPAGCFLEISKIAKDHFAKEGIKSNAGVDIPVVAVGKLGYPDIAEKALRDGMCDMIMLARPLLADPEWCNKAFAGRVDEIVPCIGCQEGCINEFVEGGHPQCAVNPRTGFEDILPEFLSKTDKPKKIGVVGGGPTGILFSVLAAKRGHSVELIERSDKLGGKVVSGSVPKIKFDFGNYLIYLENLAKRTESEGRLKILLNTAATTNWLKEQNYDAVIFAYGIDYKTPNINGIDQIKHVQATELLMNPSLLGDAEKAVVIGGGVVGCETAYWLAYEKQIETKVVEMTDQFMDGTCTANRGHIIHYLEKKNVELINCAKVVSFEGNKINIERNVSKTVPDAYNTWQPILPKNIANPLAKKLGKETAMETIDTDIVVLAMGCRADEGFFFEAQRERVAPQIYNIGDSFKAGRVLEATRSVYRLASSI